MGRVSTGVGTVLSTARRAPAACAISAAWAMSVMAQVGLAGVSSHTSRVRPGRMATSNAAPSEVSTNSTSSPQGSAKSTSHLRSAQYMTRGATT